MYHLRTCIRLLIVVRHRHRVEFAHRVIAHKHTARIFPSYGRARLDLRPEEVSILLAKASLGNEVVDATLALLVAGIPILHRRVLNLGILLHDNLDHCCVQLILVTLRCGATLQVAHISPFVRNNKRALELTRSLRIYAEVGR